MGYCISLNDPVTDKIIVLDTPHQMHGGTYAIGGTKELSISITYNYAKFYYNAMGDDGIRSIYGMTGAQSIPVLDEAIANLKNDVSDDYWEATEGNAKKMLHHLMAMATLRPDGVWDGD